MESAYWAGFLAADGCVDKNRIRLYLGIIDVGHLHKFKAFLKSRHKVAESTNYNRCSFEFSNKTIRSDLESLYLITPRKSLVLEFPEISEELLPHFIRGYFDGDGTLCETFSNVNSITSSIIAGFLGSPAFMVRCSEIVHRVINKNNTLKLMTHTNGINLILKLNTNDAKKFLTWIYKDSTPETRLDRKYCLYDRLVVQDIRKKRVLEKGNGIVHSITKVVE
jgi:hypothetical protein